MNKFWSVLKHFLKNIILIFFLGREMKGHV